MRQFILVAFTLLVLSSYGQEKKDIEEKTQSMTPVETLISYFESGAFPNSTQFKELIQSLWHKSERLPIEQIETLVDRLNVLLKTETFNSTVQDLVNDISIKLEKGLYNGTADDLHREIQSILDGAGKTYTTIASAMAVNPLPSNNTPFRIKNNPATGDDGDYIYLSTETNGYKFVGYSVAQNIDQNNTTEPVAGKAVYDEVQTQKREIYEANPGEITEVETFTDNPSNYYNLSGDLVSNGGYRTRLYTNIDISKKLYATGNVAGSIIPLVVYFDENNVFLGNEYTQGNNDTRTYENVPLNPPQGTVKIGTTSAYFPTQFPYATVSEQPIGVFASAIKQNQILSQALGYEDSLVSTDELENGYYDKNNGSFVSNGASHSRMYNMHNTEDNYYFTGNVAGTGIAGVVYFDENDVFLGNELTGTNNSIRFYERVKLNPPNGTAKIGVTTSRFPTVYPYGLIEKGILDIAPKAYVNSSLKHLNSSSKKKKSMVVFGTSIPATGYPQIVGQNLGMTTYNEAVPSSMARAFHGVTGNFKDLGLDNCLKALSHTLADKQSLIDNWTNGLDANGNITGGSYGWRDLISGASPTSAITDYYTEEQIKDFSHERKLVNKYLDSLHPDFVEMPNYFILDHGHNDLVATSYDADENAAISIPETRNDRSTFNGAMNYLIDII
ncbi:hypothetical protein Q4Q35_12415 [Flavivirga aquimarina]|uniref:Uncharacterized protein n=1 Tax=Flavivirga aquimarina TaxID=2027862 RepID=A0ABT8WC20_9FLAO|nr:hypothetical protein [Flavivirga aquimarina]MDO5970612.1 hypothetical protein [Flavivirga aquimarina]